MSGRRATGARGTGASHRIRLLLLAASLAAGCGSPMTLGHTLESPEGVARAVLAGLADRDLTRLRALEVSEDEFRYLVWPKLPASRPERNVPWDYAWKDLHGKSRLQLASRLGEWQDQGFDLVKVEFRGETTDYETFRVHRDSLLTLRDRNGREMQGRLFGSLIEQGGRWKVFSYVTD